MQQQVDILRKSFSEHITYPISWRVQQLTRLSLMIDENIDSIYAALDKDLMKPRYECMCEVLSISEEIKFALDNLRSWTSPKKISPGILHYFDTLYTQPEPYGVVLIIGPFNFPFFLVLKPLIGAIAAGNCCFVKPSEISSHSGGLMVSLMEKYLDSRCIRGVMGVPQLGEDILRIRFDYIFFTGGSRVGKLVYKAAAEHITPVTLELGGKSPVYVDKSSDPALTAKRILSAKLTNCGQVCVSPDYVLCHSAVKDALIRHLKETFESAFPLENKFNGRIINKTHFQRITRLIDSSLERVVYGGNYDAESLRMGFTIIDDPDEDSPVMREEIFGPLLPVIAVESDQRAIDFITRREKPLVLYVFSGSDSVVEKFRVGTSSGSLVVNDCLMQLSAKELPFGGVAHSGIGKYFGKSSFDAFSHHKSVYISGRFMNSLETAYRYLPYTADKMETLKSVFDMITGKRFLPSLKLFKS